MLFSYFRKIFFLYVLLNSPCLFTQEILYLGLGALQPEFYLAHKPDGKRPKPHIPLALRLNINLSSTRGVVTWSIFDFDRQVLSFSPALFLDTQKVKSSDGSFKTYWSIINLPITLTLFSNPFFETKYSLGLARTSYQIIGSGGLGGMDGLSPNPKNKIIINSYKFNTGFIFISNRVLLAFDFFIYKIASSEKRTIDFLLSLNYGVW